MIEFVENLRLLV